MGKTRLQNLVCHESGKYYARLYLNGKEIWKSLKVAHFSEAEARLGSLQKEHRKQKGRELDPSDAKMTFVQAAALHMQRVEKNVGIKRRTRQYWKETLAALLKHWPALAETEVKRVTAAACRERAARHAKTASLSHYNNTLSVLRHVIDLANENGVLYSNPALGMERKQVRPKQLELSTRTHFAAFSTKMRKAHSRDSQNCANFVQGLTFTGCRISEAAQLEWRDLDFASGEILVKGDPEEGKKNGETRRAPMISSACELFLSMRRARADELGSAKVFLVRESQKLINRAAEKIGVTRITHHDLRHLFATISIESGVDIPTVSAGWATRTAGHSPCELTGIFDGNTMLPRHEKFPSNRLPLNGSFLRF